MSVEYVIGDSIAAMRDTIEANSIDLIVTDPPYGIDFRSNLRVKTEKFDKIAGDKEVSADWLRYAYRILKDGGAIYVFTGWQVIGDWVAAIKAVGFTYKSLLVWDKMWFGSGDLKGQYSPQYEFIIFASKGRHILRGKRSRNIIRCRKLAPGALEHPSQKPLSLIAYLIEKSSDEGQLVFDPFLGIGTALLAARLANRRFLGYELDEQYKVGIDRRLSVNLGDDWVKSLLKNKVDEPTSKFGDNASNVTSITEEPPLSGVETVVEKIAEKIDDIAPKPEVSATLVTNSGFSMSL